MSDNWSKEVGNLICQLGTEHKLPLRKVAAELDIDGSTLSKIEKGERQANLDMIPIVAKIFKQDFKKLQVQFLSKLLKEEFSIDVVKEVAKPKKK